MIEALVMGTLAAAAGVALYGVLAYNRLVERRIRIHESWANVDTELKRRHDLVPNLVATVKGYAAHERDLIERVVQLRVAALQEQGDTQGRLDAERDLAGALGRLLVAVREAYPDLKADQAFQRLQRELVVTEDRIQAARRFYNANVRDYNNAVRQFPSRVVADAFKFEAHAYFELPDVAERGAPVVR